MSPIITRNPGQSPEVDTDLIDQEAAKRSLVTTQDFNFRFQNFHKVISSTPTFFFRMFFFTESHF